MNLIESIIEEIPSHKIIKIIDYVKGKKPSSISTSTIEDDLNLTSTEASMIKKIFNKTEDGDLLSIAIEAISENQLNQDKVTARLVMTTPSKFQTNLVDFTHEKIYQMINRAKDKITIIGYWVYDMQDLFKELSRLQETKKDLDVWFILDDARKWAPRIKKNWNKENQPKIFEVNKEHIKTLHAKIIIIDNKEILVTSANLTINAMKKNIEAGIWSCDKNLVKSCSKIFENFETKKVIKEVSPKKYGDI